jgi:hypothetical protein
MVNRPKIPLLLVCLFIGLNVLLQSKTATAQGIPNWSPQERIPGFSNDTEPPILIADQNHIVHAFASQWLNTDVGQSEFAIIYSRWTLDQGWTKPNDIVLSPFKHKAQIMSVYLDKAGIFHLIFYGGDNTGASIYYSKAPALNVDEASAWSTPLEVGIDAQSPGSAAIVGDDKGNLIIIYAGTQDGDGVYFSSSSDGGSSWSAPELIFLAQNDQPLIFNLQMYKGQSGWLHVIWNNLDMGGQGRSIYYTRTKIDNIQWSTPFKLADSQSGYGVLTPTIIEYHGILFALFNITPKIVMRLSNDEGGSWVDPVVPFANYTGVNGTLSLVVDGNSDLNLFFGQRIPGSPDIHGMWHSVWQIDNWSVPDPVVSGPRMMTGNNQSFDPFNARAVSLDNSLLVTWRTDPGNGLQNNNGVWYSYKTIGLGTSPAQPLITSQPSPTTNPEYATPVAVSGSNGENPYPSPPVDKLNPSLVNGLFSSGDPLSTVALGIIPVILVIFGIIFVTQRSHQ